MKPITIVQTTYIKATRAASSGLSGTHKALLPVGTKILAERISNVFDGHRAISADITINGVTRFYKNWWLFAAHTNLPVDPPQVYKPKGKS